MSKLKITVILWKLSISVQNISFRLLKSQLRDQINDHDSENFQECEFHLSVPGSVFLNPEPNAKFPEHPILMCVHKCMI